MKITDGLHDVSVLTNVPKRTLERIMAKLVYSITETMEEVKKEDEEKIIGVNIGLGILYIKFDDVNDIKYKFVPSERLGQSVSDTAKNKLNLMQTSLNASFIEKLELIYKDLC